MLWLVGVGKSSYMPLHVRQWSPTFFKPFLSPTSDQNEFPPNIIRTLSRENVTTINKIIANRKISIKGYFAECRTPMLNDSWSLSID